MAFTTRSSTSAPVEGDVLRSRPFLLIALTVFVDLLGVGLIIPVAPFYATNFGADAVQVGLIFTAYSIAQFLTSPALGVLSDRVGRRPVLLACLSGEAVGFLLLGLATNLPMVYLARVLAGGFAGNISAAQAYVADITPPPERTRTFGTLGAIFGVAFMAGPALGGVLSGFDMRAPAFAAAALALVNVLGVALWLPESLPPERRSTGQPGSMAARLNPAHVLWTLLRRPAFRGLLVGAFLLNFAFSGLQTNFPVYGHDRFGFGPPDVAKFFVAIGVVSVLMQGFVLRRLNERLPDLAILLLGVGVGVVAYVLTAVAPGAEWLALSLASMSASNALTRPPLTGLISRLAGPAEQGLASGAFQGTNALSAIGGPLWAGWIYQQVGQPAPYLGGAVLIVVAGLVVLAGSRSMLGTLAATAARAEAAR